MHISPQHTSARAELAAAALAAASTPAKQPKMTVRPSQDPAHWSEAVLTPWPDWRFAPRCIGGRDASVRIASRLALVSLLASLPELFLCHAADATAVVMDGFVLPPIKLHRRVTTVVGVREQRFNVDAIVFVTSLSSRRVVLALTPACPSVPRGLHGASAAKLRRGRNLCRRRRRLHCSFGLGHRRCLSCRCCHRPLLVRGRSPIRGQFTKSWESRRLVVLCTGRRRA